MELHLMLDGIVAEDQLYQQLGHVDIEGISANSSGIKPNHLFVAIPGYQRDGHEFIYDAIHAGANAVVGEKDMGELDIPYIQVPNSRLALGKMAGRFYAQPSKKHKIIGVTGTNGKTTTSFMLKHILEESGLSCSIIGTVFNQVNGQITPSANTTPDALTLHQLIAKSDDDIIIIEVSSHGLSQHRVEGIEFDYCLFTNLDHEHLDYHQDMEEYFSVKASLFDKLNPKGKAVINTYNSWGERLAGLLKDKSETVFTLGETSVHDLKIYPGKPEDASAVLSEGRAEHPIMLKVPGLHNIHNAAMAFLTAKDLGVPSSCIIESLKGFKGVEGRFEVMNCPNGATVVVDYAHTADAFFHCLKTAKEQGAKRIFHVFGFRGGRDESKRKGMLKVSSEWSDLCVLTLDDLNHVSQEEMVHSLKGLHVPASVFVIPDRTLAIQFAWERVKDGDWIIVTGKGAEPYQQSYQLPSVSDMETIQYLNALQ